MKRSALWRLALGVALGAPGLVACDDQQPDPTGDLERPAAMAIIPRYGDPDVIGEARADLLIVDSEAQGVRVQQYLQIKELSGTSTLTLRRNEFVLGPAVLFPMVVPAEGFPTEISVPEGRDRAYTIAPAAPRRVPHQDSDLEGKADLLGKKDPDAPTEGRLYVHDVTEAVSVPGRASDPGNVTLGFVVLDDPDRVAVPVDVLAWPGADPSTDRVMVLFDALDGTGRVIAYDVDVAASPSQLEPLIGEVPGDLSSPTVAFDIDVSSAPRQLVALPEDPEGGPRTVLVANAGGDEVGQLSIDGDSVTFAAVPGVGPTSRIVPVSPTQALALRTDTPAAIVLEADASGAFARATGDFTSPYTTVETRSSSIAGGRIDLPQVASTGAIGFPVGFPTIDDAATTGVVMLAMVDGSAIFLRGDDLSMVTPSTPEVTLMRADRQASDGTYIRECGPGTAQWCVDPDADAQVCVGLVQTPRGSDARYAASYQGNLVSTRDWYFSASARGGEAVLEVGADLTTAHALQVGDSVLLQAFEGCIVQSDVGTVPGPWTAWGAVTEVRGRQLSVRFGIVEGGIDGTGQGMTLDLAAGALDLSACEGVGLLEAWPAGREVVLAEIDGREVIEVHARVPVLPGVEGSEIARIEARPDGSPAPLAFTLVGPSGGFVRERGVATDRRCVFDSQCGPGRQCLQTGEATDQVCPLRCSACTGDACSDEADVVWHRSGVELGVLGTAVESQDLGRAELRGEISSSTETVNAVPYETVWLDVWNQWVTSFPGSRTLVRLEYGSEAERASVTR